MKNAIYSLVNYGPDEEHFTIRMRNVVLQMASTSLFGPLVIILAPHLGQPISEATHTVSDLEEAEAMRAWKGIWSAT